MKCQYSEIASTPARLGVRRSAMAKNAITPPTRCNPCAPLSKYKNELLGLVDRYTPAAANCRQASTCPPKNATPNAVLIHHHWRNVASKPLRSAFLADSTVRLDITSSPEFSHKTRGKAVGCQSNETPRRTIKALVKAMKTMVMPIIASQTPSK